MEQLFRVTVHYGPYEKTVDQSLLLTRTRFMAEKTSKRVAQSTALAESASKVRRVIADAQGYVEGTIAYELLNAARGGTPRGTP